MQRKQPSFRAMRRRLLARASVLAMRVALRPRGWASGLLAAGLVGASAPALAQEVIDLATDAELVIQGAAAGDNSGWSVSGAGDVDGDGIADLIIGARLADPNGRDFAGASYVVLGSDQGLPPIIDLASDADLIIQGAAASDFSGFSVSDAGDIDGDGIDDLIIGAQEASPSGRAGAGASYVIFGTHQGLPLVIDLATDADLIIQGVARGDRSGSSVSGAGDVDGDGIDDLIIGAPYAHQNGLGEAGASYVVFGTDHGLPATIDLTSEADVVIQGTAQSDFSGVSVSGAGDVNGDGIDDLIIGALRADPNGRDGAGASYVVFGTDQGFPASIDLATDADLVIQGAAPFDYSGRSVSGAGDVDGDGIDDLIIGATGADPSGQLSAGASYVVFGTDQGFPPTIDLASDADLIIQGAAGEYSGWSVSGAGDVNGDGVDDLIIGAIHASPSGRVFAGASYVVFGSDQGLPAVIDLASEADLVIQGAAVFDSFGWSVSGAGDVNGDGIDDLIIGAQGANPNGRNLAGASYVVFGGPAAALERLLARVDAAGLPDGIENSLVNVLERALGLLARSNTTGVIGIVGAFGNRVEAQRGNQIDEADADAWIAAAETILDMLGAS